jgi:hypothetical protein
MTDDNTVLANISPYSLQHRYDTQTKRNILLQENELFFIHKIISQKTLSKLNSFNFLSTV